MVRPTRFLLLVLTAAALPASAGAAPRNVTGPGVCNGRAISIDEDERLEERTLYFHGSARLGNVDALVEVAQPAYGALRMDGVKPTSDDTKLFLTRPTGTVGNPGYNRNYLHGYWERPLQAEERIVCAGARVHAETTQGGLGAALWLDKITGTAGTPTATAGASAAPGQVSPYVFDFGALDARASKTIVIQLDSTDRLTVTHYDSTSRPSALSYVVVVPA